MKLIKCDTCRYFIDVNVWHCRRFPPQAMSEVGGVQDLQKQWSLCPTVRRDFWCGEHSLSLMRLWRMMWRSKN